MFFYRDRKNGILSTLPIKTLQLQRECFILQGMKRHYSKLISELLGFFPCLAITGIRQSGKTTLLHRLPPEWRIFDLEKADDFDLISRDPDLFLRLNPQHTAIDECQLLPELFPALRVAVDAARNQSGRFVVTGSSSLTLLKSISESLAGRVAILEVAPFSLAEAYAKPASLFYDYIVEQSPLADFLSLESRLTLQEQYNFWLRGGFPDPWLRNNARYSKMWMQNYIKTYIERDIRPLFPSLNHQKYRLFIQMLSHFSGTIINYAEAARVLGVSQPTARDYFQIAHGTFLWRHIPAYEKNAGKRIVKHPKGHIRDSGLLHFMLHLHSLDDLLSHPKFGHSWEAMVIENLCRGLDSIGAAYDYFHYRTSGGAEVDLVLEGEFGLLPIEIKFGQKVAARELRGIRDFIKERKCRYGIVINNSERPTIYNENLIGIPFSCL